MKMAADESLLEGVDEEILDGFVKLQGHIRGMLIRKALHDIQKDYEDIVADLEEDMTVCWPSKTLGKPCFMRKRQNSRHASQNKTTNHASGDPRPVKTTRDVCVLDPVQDAEIQETHHSRNLSNVYYHASNINKDKICDNNKNDFNSRFEEVESPVSDKHSTFSPRINLNQSKVPQVCEADKQISIDKLVEPDQESKALDLFASKEVQTSSVLDEITADTPEKLSSAENVEDRYCQTSPWTSAITDELSTEGQLKENNNAYNKNDVDSEKTQIFNASSPPNVLNLHEYDKGSGSALNTKSSNPPFAAGDLAVVESNRLIHRNSTNATNQPGNDHAHSTTGGIECGKKADLAVKESGSQFDLPKDRDGLLKIKSTLTMELLWIEQAINSRKNYLRLKQQMG